MNQSQQVTINVNPTGESYETGPTARVDLRRDDRSAAFTGMEAGVERISYRDLLLDLQVATAAR